MKNFLVLLSALFFINVCAQNPTVGLIHNSSNAFNGYTLFSPLNSHKSYIIDNCGYVVHEWLFDHDPFYTAYLKENGNIVRLNISNQGIYIEERDWDNNIVWSYFPPLEYQLHSDFAMMENGNYLVIFEEQINILDWINKGGNPNIPFPPTLEAIVEIEPVGNDSANLVWEWHAFDHMMQTTDSSFSNFGQPSDFPRKLNINYTNTTSSFQAWMHYNGIDYNEKLDQIAISCWTCSEIFIIDHSTTTAEAATASGGIYGFGGDFLFRYGNPINYEAGEIEDRVFYGQHNPSWIKEGLPFEGQLTVFENGNGRPNIEYSRVVILDTQVDTLGNYNLISGQPFGPNNFTFEWNGTVNGDLFFTRYMGGVNMQPNGNLTVCEAVSGRFFEIEPSTGNVVWHYQNPDGGGILNQYMTNPVADSYRAEKYPPDYPAFDGKDLSPIEIIEAINLVSENCEIFWEVFFVPGFTFENVENSTFAFTDTSTNAISWIWDFGDGTSSSDQNPTHTFEALGTYEVCVTVYADQLLFGNVWEEICTTINVNVLNLENETGNSILFYPNPVQNILNVNFSPNKYTFVNIYNVEMKLIGKFPFKNKIDFSRLKPGIYWIELVDNNKKIIAKNKIVKI